MLTGVLALQGDFEAHGRVCEALGHKVRYIRNAEEFSGLDALILPGGESSAMLKLFSQPLKDRLIEFVQSGSPVLATCAGVILLARKVRQPEQESLGLLDIEVLRNAYGRQTESFVSDEVSLNDAGRGLLGCGRLEGVFIRAPQISAVGGAVQMLATCRESPVLIRQDNIWGATFHPELSREPERVYQAILTAA